MTVAHVPGFGAGVVLEGSADAQRTDEVRSCDGYDIGPRGQLIAARDLSDYVTINDAATVPAPWTRLYGLRAFSGNAGFLRQIAVGEGVVTATAAFLLAQFLREDSYTPIAGAPDVLQFGAAEEGGVTLTVPVPKINGVQVTIAPFPGAYKVWYPAAANRVNVCLVNIGAREERSTWDFSTPGLYALLYEPVSNAIALYAISLFDALGTGSRGELKAGGGAAGTKTKQLYFRGIAAYNSFAMGWGFDRTDTSSGEGPARLMFSNINNPLKWGNDNQGAVGTDRDFTDSDAIPIGDAGEIIRAGLAWNKRFWIGTDQKLHFLAGYGRDSFITDGSNPVAKAENVIGPNCMIEGPDSLLYGVGDKGLWAFDGNTFERHHVRLRDYAGASLGWWDLIWNDRSFGVGLPGKTNADLVWMAVDWDLEQVVVGIPWCDAVGGVGYGTDTVVIKFHPRTGGFTRQVFSGVQYTAADYVRRQRQFGTARFVGTATAGYSTVRRYGSQMSPLGAGGGAYVATPAPSVEIGPYALYGPDGAGVYRRGYLTIAWEQRFLPVIGPMSFTLTPTVDGQSLPATTLTVHNLEPVAPAEGDLWLDTSTGDANLGNGTAGDLVRATADYLLKVRRNSAWAYTGFGGQQATAAGSARATIPIAWLPTKGTRFTMVIANTAWAGRWQVEGWAFKPGAGSDSL